MNMSYEEVKETVLWIAEKWGEDLKNSVSRGLDVLKAKGIKLTGTEKTIFHWMIRACVEIGDRKNAEILQRAEMEHDPVQILMNRELLKKFWGKRAANSIHKGLPIILEREPGTKTLFSRPKEKSGVVNSVERFSAFGIMIRACEAAGDYRSANMFRKIEKTRERARVMSFA